MSCRRRRRHCKRDRHCKRRRDHHRDLEVEQFSINEPDEPFAIAKHNSAAAASDNDEAIAQLASGRGSENETNDD